MLLVYIYKSPIGLSTNHYKNTLNVRISSTNSTIIRIRHVL